MVLLRAAGLSIFTTLDRGLPRKNWRSDRLPWHSRTDQRECPESPTAADAPGPGPTAGPRRRIGTGCR